MPWIHNWTSVFLRHLETKAQGVPLRLKHKVSTTHSWSLNFNLAENPAKHGGREWNAHSTTPHTVWPCRPSLYFLSRMFSLPDFKFYESFCCPGLSSPTKVRWDLRPLPPFPTLSPDVQRSFTKIAKCLWNWILGWLTLSKAWNCSARQRTKRVNNQINAQLKSWVK